MCKLTKLPFASGSIFHSRPSKGRFEFFWFILWTGKLLSGCFCSVWKPLEHSESCIFQGLRLTWFRLCTPISSIKLSFFYQMGAQLCPKFLFFRGTLIVFALLLYSFFSPDFMILLKVSGFLGKNIELKLKFWPLIWKKLLDLPAPFSSAVSCLASCISR